MSRRTLANQIRQLPLLRRTYVVRGLVLWAALRAVVALVGAARGDMALATQGRIVLLGIVALVVYIEMRRRREVVFVANLGVPAHVPVFLSIACPAALELLLP